jgi:hypothetical protein
MGGPHNWSGCCGEEYINIFANISLYTETIREIITSGILKILLFQLFNDAVNSSVYYSA